MSEYTKGPWLIAEEDSRFIYALGPQGTNLFWCKVDKAGPEKISDSEAKANARLIAAAPELLEVLIEVFECSQLVPCTANPESAACFLMDANIMDLVRAAIAKAKGES